MKTIFQGNKIIFLIVSLLFFLCFSCNLKKQILPAGAASKAKPKPVPQTQIETKMSEKSRGIDHYVRWHGETLSIIAKWYTGALNNWETLAAINTQIDSSLLYINNKIHIPGRLIKTRKPMPKEFLDKFYKKEEVKDPEIINPDENPDDIPLFGPKTYPTK